MAAIAWTTERTQAIVNEIEKVIVGKRTSVELVVIGLLSNGHVLIEDIPGVGQDHAGRSLCARGPGRQYRRVQFTPDLLPADITGTSIFNQQTGQFAVPRGPRLHQRAARGRDQPRRRPSPVSLLECMEEFQVTTDGGRAVMQRPFFVIATENPIEYRGTYPLPEAQLDRFLMRIRMGYPSPAEEVMVLDRHAGGHPCSGCCGRWSPGKTCSRCRSQVRDVHLDDVAEELPGRAGGRHPPARPALPGRQPPRLPRPDAHRARRAALPAGSYVLPDDVKALAAAVLCHRLVLKPSAVAAPEGAAPWTRATWWPRS